MKLLLSRTDISNLLLQFFEGTIFRYLTSSSKEVKISTFTVSYDHNRDPPPSTKRTNLIQSLPVIPHTRYAPNWTVPGLQHCTIYARKDGLLCGVSHCSQMHIVCTYLNICIVFLLYAKLGGNSNTVQSELSPIVQWMEFGPSSVTVLLNQNHFQYCVLPYIFFNIIDYCLLHY